MTARSKATHTRWQQGLSRLRAYAQAHGAANPPTSAVVDGFRLGRWAAVQRERYWADRSPPDHLTALQAVPGWDWGRTNADRWSEGLTHLRSYLDEHGTTAVDTRTVHEGFELGGWVARRRANYHHNTLSPTRIVNAGPKLPTESSMEEKPQIRGCCRSPLGALHGQRVLDVVPAGGDHDAGIGGAGGPQVVRQGGQQQVVAVFDRADRGLFESHALSELGLGQIRCGADRGQIHLVFAVGLVHVLTDRRDPCLGARVLQRPVEPVVAPDEVFGTVHGVSLSVRC